MRPKHTKFIEQSVLLRIVMRLLMKRAPTFHIRSLTHLPLSPTQSRVEANIADNADAENADESVAFSVLVRHGDKPSVRDLRSAALKRARDILASQRA
jgi:hypothetical protein